MGLCTLDVVMGNRNTTSLNHMPHSVLYVVAKWILTQGVLWQYNQWSIYEQLVLVTVNRLLFLVCFYSKDISMAGRLSSLCIWKGSSQIPLQTTSLS